jgi:hypothetical protein
MGKIVLTILGWIANKVGLLIMVLLLFIAGTYLKNEFDKLEQARKDNQRGTDIYAETDPNNITKSLQNVLGGELPSAQASLAEIGLVRERLHATRNSKKIERDKIEKDASLLELKVPVSAPSLQLLKLDVDIEVLDQADRHVSEIERRARDISMCERTPKVSCGNQIRQLQTQVAQHGANINAWNNQIQGIHAQNPILAGLCTSVDGNAIGALPCRQIAVHQRAIALAQNQLLQASMRINNLRQAEKAANEPFSFTFRSVASIEAKRALLRSHSDQLETWLAKNWLEQSIGLVKSQLLYAIWTLLAAILTPLLVRAGMWASAKAGRHLGSISIFPDCDSNILVSESSTNCAVDLTVGDELLVHPDYPLSKSDGLQSTTQAILDRTKPLVSLASGMFYLTRVDTQTAGTAVVSVPQSDPLSRLSVVDLPEHSSLVLRPRYLVGVVQKKNGPLSITSHYRLFSSASWLAMQFRYIVFHGPGKVILKGGQGVIAETVQCCLESNRHLTIGYTANLAYSVIRRSDFWPFVFGHVFLGGERFAGQKGIVLSSATPSSMNNVRSSQGGLPNWLDALMKPFGF